MSNNITADIGLIGLGVMGKSLARNLAGHGSIVAVYNVPIPGEEHVTDAFVKEFGSFGFLGCSTLEELVARVSKPAIIHLMVKAGDPVDQVIGQLAPLLTKDDIIVDGGNSNFRDTERRMNELKKKGLLFVGMGISGGEKGALMGPSMMPGGDLQAKSAILRLYTPSAAIARDGHSCINWIGSGGAGHFVKMVHNGIEYAEMQLIAEVYHLLTKTYELTLEETAEVFEKWNSGTLASYLLEITASILRRKEDDTPLLDKILDVASQKGTGKWTVEAAFDLGVSIPSITAAVDSRIISSDKDIRLKFSDLYASIEGNNSSKPVLNTEKIRHAFTGAKFSIYSQGLNLIRQASNSFHWEIDMPALIRTWQGGCIIRSDLLNSMIRAFDKNASLVDLILDKHMAKQVLEGMLAWQQIQVDSKSPQAFHPCFTASYGYVIQKCTANSPLNLIQAQRDFFGAHTYERTDRPRGEFFHTRWED